jgi:hypothetical protein
MKEQTIKDVSTLKLSPIVEDQRKKLYTRISVGKIPKLKQNTIMYAEVLLKKTFDRLTNVRQLQVVDKELGILTSRGTYVLPSQDSKIEGMKAQCHSIKKARTLGFNYSKHQESSYFGFKLQYSIKKARTLGVPPTSE